MSKNWCSRLAILVSVSAPQTTLNCYATGACSVVSPSNVISISGKHIVSCQIQVLRHSQLPRIMRNQSSSSPEEIKVLRRLLTHV